MRHAALAIAVLLATPALAQTTRTDDGRVWTAAPVPGVHAPTVAPADRAGHSSGPDNASPFSGAPSGSAGAEGQTPLGTNAPAGTRVPSVSR